MNEGEGDIYHFPWGREKRSQSSISNKFIVPEYTIESVQLVRRVGTQVLNVNLRNLPDGQQGERQS